MAPQVGETVDLVGRMLPENRLWQLHSQETSLVLSACALRLRTAGGWQPRVRAHRQGSARARPRRQRFCLPLRRGEAGQPGRGHGRFDRLGRIRPALTCDAVISEACFLLRGAPDSQGKVLALVERGILRIVPVLPDESPALRSLLARHGQRMDYADACLVRLSELYRRNMVVTTDAEDLRIYRWFGRQALALRAPRRPRAKSEKCG